MLKKKQAIKSNDDWIKCKDSATSLISKSEVDNLVSKTVDRILEITNGKKCCSGYCAGKDSIVLDSILRKAGIAYQPIMWYGVNNYPAMEKWIADNAPHNLKKSIVGKFTLKFLEDHPEYLFCIGKETRNKWMSEKWKKQSEDKKNYDIFIVGRRLLDGNVCGKVEDSFVRNGTFSPIADWSHEQLFAYLEYENIQLPPFYEWERGFLLGSVAMGEWTERPANELLEEEVWDELWRIDESIVEKASKHLSRARKYMERKNGAN